jgi:hypothetical protein
MSQIRQADRHAPDHGAATAASKPSVAEATATTANNKAEKKSRERRQ